MGASWWDPKIIDAFVIMPKELNKKYLEGKKQQGEGFEDDYYEKTVVPYIETLRKYAKKFKIPLFDSIESCAKYIIKNDYKTNISVGNFGYFII